MVAPPGRPPRAIPATGRRTAPSTWPTRALGLLAVVVVVGVLATPLVATLRYRSAIGGLHAELRVLVPPDAALVVEEIQRCHDGSAPASLRRFAPAPIVGEVTGETAADRLHRWYAGELGRLGFERSSATRWTTEWHRNRADALDADVVRLTRSDDGQTLTVIAGAHDTDSVICSPL